MSRKPMNSRPEKPLKFKLEAQIVFDKLSKYSRFNDTFRKAELKIYEQKEKMISQMMLKKIIKFNDCSNIIDQLIKQEIIGKKTMQYELKKISKEKFIKAIKEEKILIRELSHLRFGEVDEAQVEVLDIILQKVSDERGFINSIIKSYKERTPLITTILKKYRILPSTIKITYPMNMDEDKGKKIDKQLKIIKSTLEEKINSGIDNIQMLKVLKENDKYITESKEDIIKNYSKTWI